MNKYVLLYITICILSCTPKTALDAQQIVDKAIEVSGGEIIKNSSIAFKFRKHFYKATRNTQGTILERCNDENCITQHDQIFNGSFKRFRESEAINVPDSLKNRYANSVNSVHYFSILPFGLNDKAVNKKLLDETTINNKTYYRLLITFNKDGGGDDFDDQYLYWVNKENFKVDYLAYNYQVNEGGTRFREAYNERYINGIRFVDYRNYKPKTKFPELKELALQHQLGKLDLLSTIDLENIKVKQCPDC